MRTSGRVGVCYWPLLTVLALSWAAAAQAQDLVPGAYTPAPVGVNVLSVTAGVS